MTSSRITLILGFIRLLISTSTVFAQPVNNYVKDVSMPAPNAAALGKYGDYSVGNFTGVPDISIPIYTVQEGPLSLPIGLSYHASGIKAAEMASWVGAGWALNCGGIISRTVQGLKDEHANGYYNTASLLQDRILNAGSTPALNGQLNEDIVNNVIDGEPDIFSFNVSGYTGKFYIDQARHVQFIPKQDLKLEFDAGYEGFTIVTPDGTRYSFGAIGATTVEYAQEKTWLEGLGLGDAYTTSWYLLKVESYDRLYKINLSYTDENYSYLSAASVKWNVTLGTGRLTQGYDYASENGDAYHKTHKMNLIGTKLRKITTTTDSINFVTTNIREDLDGGVKSLDKIEIFTGDKCQKFDFAYTYFQDPTSVITYSPTSSVAKKLRLESLRQTSCNNAIINPPHVFSYNGNFLVHRLSKAIDHWGFYNGASNNETMIDNIPPTIITSAGLPPFSHGSANRETNETEMMRGVLTQIQYPTGGTTNFTFEANTASILAQTAPLSVYTLASCSSPISQDCCGTGTNGQTLTTATYKPTKEDILSGTFILSLDKLTGNNGASFCPTYDPATYIYIYDGTTRVGSLSLTLISGETSASSTSKPLSYLGITDTTVTYSFELYSTNAYSRFKIYNQPTILSNKVVGGLRIKEIKTSDGISTVNDIVKQYDYSIETNANISSGRLLKMPKYGYDGGIVKLNTDQTNCIVGYGTFLSFNDESVVPLYTFEGNHIGYQMVKETQVGNGSKLYKYNLDLPTIQGLSTETSVPYPTPPYDPMVSNGQMSELHILSSAGTEVKATQNTIYGETPTFSIGKIRKVIKHSFPSNSDPNACPGALFWAQLHTDYFIRTQPYRLQSVTETLDKVPTTTTFTYSADANQPFFPLTISMKNSDNKTTVTTNKYVTHADYDTDPVATQLRFFNIISIRLKSLQQWKVYKSMG